MGTVLERALSPKQQEYIEYLKRNEKKHGQDIRSAHRELLNKEIGYDFGLTDRQMDLAVEIVATAEQ